MKTHEDYGKHLGLIWRYDGFPISSQSQSLWMVTIPTMKRMKTEEYSLQVKKGKTTRKKQKPRKMENTIVEKRQYKKDRTVEGNQEKERKAERKQTETITHETTGNGKNENKNIHLKA